MGLKAKLPEVGLTKPNVLQHHSTTWISISQHHTPHHQGSPVIVMGRIKTKASIATTPPGGGGRSPPPPVPALLAGAPEGELAKDRTWPHWTQAVTSGYLRYGGMGVECGVWDLWVA